MKLKNRRDLSLCARPGRTVCSFVIREIEKQCDKQGDAPLATKPTGLRSTLRDSIPTLLQRIRCLSVKAVSEGQNRAHESYKCFWVGLVGGFCHFRVEVNQLYLLNFCPSWNLHIQCPVEVNRCVCA